MISFLILVPTPYPREKKKWNPERARNAGLFTWETLKSYMEQARIFFQVVPNGDVKTWGPEEPPQRERCGEFQRNFFNWERAAVHGETWLKLPQMSFLLDLIIPFALCAFEMNSICTITIKKHNPLPIKKGSE